MENKLLAWKQSTSRLSANLNSDPKFYRKKLLFRAKWFSGSCGLESITVRYQSGYVADRYVVFFLTTWNKCEEQNIHLNNVQFFPTCAGGWGGGEFENHLVLLWLDGWHLFKICDVKRCKTWEELITLQNSKTSIDTGKWNLKTSKNVKQTPPNSVWNITKIKERCLKVNVQKWPWSKTILKI